MDEKIEAGQSHWELKCIPLKKPAFSSHLLVDPKRLVHFVHLALSWVVSGIRRLPADAWH
jgi:hypothetical protein